jgi:hypothetical protein
MNIGISAQSVAQAKKDAEKYQILEPAEQEYNILRNDGMTLKIVQDNMIDWVVNKVDNKRIILEKKAEILHDYYGDRLIARDMFKDYLSYKKYTGGIANLLSAGLIGANLYTRVMKNSILMGKVGTISTIIALQSLGRYYSNKWLESQIENPWRIHTNRMAQGLGPTNVPHNHHKEVENFPLRFIVIYFN